MTRANHNSRRASPMPAIGTMKRFAFLPHLLLVLSLLFSAGSSLADDDCDVPTRLWQSRDAVREMAAARGWEIKRLKIDDGCYEIRGIDAEGRAFKAKIDPQTLEIMKFKRKDRDGKPKGVPTAPPPDASHNNGDGSGNPPPDSAPAMPPRNPVDR